MPEFLTLYDWVDVQARFADLPGEKGIALRAKHYAPFFLGFGSGVQIEEGCRFFKPEFIFLEDDVRINIGGLFYGSGGIVIGRHVRVGPRCFVHSANHDIAPDDPRAFFERGYDYRRTVIGANCLISANVSILPGAVLGHGSFVACGAVVACGDHGQGSRLFGTPAQHRAKKDAGARTTSAQDYPEIAFIVPQDRSDLADAVDLLRETLGLVQAVCLHAGAPVPGSVAVVVCLGGATPALGCAAEVWHVVPGDVLLDPEAPVILADGDEVRLPDARILAPRPIPGPGASAIERFADLAYWLQARLFKRSDALSRAELREWLVALHLLDWPHVKRSAILKALYRRRPIGSNLVAPQSSNTDVVTQWLDATARFADVSARKTPGLSDKLRMLRQRWQPRRRRHGTELTRKTALATPVDLVARCAAASDESERKRLEALLVDLLPHCDSSLRWVAAGLAGYLLGRADVTAQAAEALHATDRKPSRGGTLLQQPGGPTLLLSPLYLVWLLLVERGDAAIPEKFLDVPHLRESLPWRGFVGTGESPAVRKCLLVDEVARRISTDLLENWLALQTANCTADHCLDLTSYAYNPTVERLEAQWLKVFRHLLARNGRPMIRLRPWPAPYRAALSLRFDVDRPISVKRLVGLVRLQGQYARAPLGSWYFRRGDTTSDLLRPYLERASQDIGIHIEELEEITAGSRVTHHSAPTSAYWQGDVTTRALAAAGAAYGEFHGAALPTPRRAWLAPETASDGMGRLTDVTLTALHFPLEGGTEDHDLSYFDRLLQAFRERLEAGGHAILGTHPDLDQRPFNELLAREDLAAVWKATVADVVARWNAVMKPGRVRLVRLPCGGYGLSAAGGLEDLQVEITPVGSPPSVLVLQLAADMPLPLMFDPTVE